ncbi:hypothetical protein B7P43_G00905 [Cryptotermes secundus]|uniref:Uncharacterized protein n=2 Tax=Cryptotermes secundus TaxID=105785 RepID=A0A2J7RT31_9NEOP|nr:hypothetical protein B7P43_G00905 [Cryptotermes secundus]
MKYRQHLDWHFHQNRRQKDSGHNQSRDWYLSLSDWMQCTEFEDPEEIGPCWFEMQQAEKGREKEVQEVPSVCAGENPNDAFCGMCSDKFEQFFNDEIEEWHLRGAVRVDGKTFHPLCSEDYKRSLEESGEETCASQETKGVEEQRNTDSEIADDKAERESNVETMDT